MLCSKALCWYCNALLCPRWHRNVSLTEARGVLLKDAWENAKGSFYFSCSWGGWPRKGKTQRCTHISTQVHFDMLYVRMVIMMEREATECLPRKMAILKQSSLVRRKHTTTERTLFQLANPDGSLCVFFFFFKIIFLNKKPCLQWHLVAIVLTEFFPGLLQG